MFINNPKVLFIVRNETEDVWAQVRTRRIILNFEDLRRNLSEAISSIRVSGDLG